MAHYTEYVQLLREILSDRVSAAGDLREVIRMRPHDLVISAEKIWPGITFIWKSTLEKYVLATCVRFLLFSSSFPSRDLPLRIGRDSTDRRHTSEIGLPDSCVFADFCVLPVAGDAFSVSEEFSETSSVFDCEALSVSESVCLSVSPVLEREVPCVKIGDNREISDGMRGSEGQVDAPTSGISSFDAYREPRREESEGSETAAVRDNMAAENPVPQYVPQVITPPAMPQVQYVMQPQAYPLPDPGLSEAPIFNGRDATEFVRWFERMCKRRRVTIWEDLCENFPDYCQHAICIWIESLPVWKNGDWKGLKEQFCQRFEDQDSEYQQFTCEALDALVYKTRNTEEEVRHYTVEFASVSNILLHRGVTIELQRCELFLHGLPQDIRARIVKHERINFNKPSLLCLLALS